jgi:hypothetical protein
VSVNLIHLNQIQPKTAIGLPDLRLGERVIPTVLLELKHGVSGVDLIDILLVLMSSQDLLLEAKNST